MSSIQLIRQTLADQFTQIPNELIRNTTLKINETMALIWLLSHNENWQLNTKSISKHLRIGNTQVTNISKSLQKNNYLIIQKSSTGHTQWIIFDCPKICLAYKKENNIKPDLGKQDVATTPVKSPNLGKPDMGKQDALRIPIYKKTKDIYNIQNENVKLIIDKFQRQEYTHLEQVTTTEYATLYDALQSDFVDFDIQKSLAQIFKPH